MTNQIEIQGRQVPLLVEVVMHRLQEVTERCSELERALSDVPRPTSAEVQHLESLKARLAEAEGKYDAARDDRAQLHDELQKVVRERKEALESSNALQKKLLAMEEQMERANATVWRSVQRHLDIALEKFEDDPDKCFDAITRARHFLTAKADNDQAK